MNTDNNGNYVSSIGVVSGNSTALMSLENSFHQDLNGDGHIGVSGTGGTGGTGGTVIESNGATSLTQVGDQYYLYDSKGVGPSLKISGVDHLASAAGIAGVGHRLPRRRRRPDMRSPGRPWEPISTRYGTPTTTATTSRISALCQAIVRYCKRSRPVSIRT